MINKEELLSAFKDKDFVKNVILSMTEVIDTVSQDKPKYGIDKIIEDGRLPFERNREKESIVIEKALEDIDFDELKQIIRAISIVNSSLDDLYSDGFYKDSNKMKENVRAQFKQTFDALELYPILECYTGDSKGDVSYKYMVDGRFYTEASYWKNDETNEWEPYVTFKFSPSEYLNY